MKMIELRGNRGRGLRSKAGYRRGCDWHYLESGRLRLNTSLTGCIPEVSSFRNLLELLIFLNPQLLLMKPFSSFRPASKRRKRRSFSLHINEFRKNTS